MLLKSANTLSLNQSIVKFARKNAKVNELCFDMALIAYSVVTRKIATCESFGKSIYTDDNGACYAVNKSKATISKYVKSITWLIENNVLTMVEETPSLFSMSRIGEVLSNSKFADTVKSCGKTASELLSMDNTTFDSIFYPTESESESESGDNGTESESGDNGGKSEDIKTWTATVDGLGAVILYSDGTWKKAE